MTAQGKKTFGDAMAWILRSMTAIGAFFLIELVSEIKEMHRDQTQGNQKQAVMEQRVNALEVGQRRHENRLNQLQHIAYDND